MLKTLFMTTAIAALTLAPATSTPSWAQQERAPGEPGMEHPSAKPAEKMQSPSRGENAQPGHMPSPQKGAQERGAGEDRKPGDNGGKTEPGRASEQPNPHEERGSRQTQERDEPKGREDRKGREEGRGRENRNSQESQGQERKGQEQRENRAASQGEHERGGARISSEQRGKLHTGFKGATLREATNLNIPHVRVGESIPREVAEYWAPVPRPILEIVPDWQDYRIVRVGGDILVIDPETFEIVYIFS